MDKAIKITIYDQDGNSLLADRVTSPFVGLQAGETFWFGDENNRTWAKVIKITYGLNTVEKCFVIDLVVESSETKETKKVPTQATTIDHGEKRIEGKGGGSWSINNSDILVMTGSPTADEIQIFTLQIKTPGGTEIKKETQVKAGEYIEIATPQRKVTCILTNIECYDFSTVRVIETRYS